MSDIMLLRLSECTDTKEDIIFLYKTRMDMGFVNFRHTQNTLRNMVLKKLWFYVVINIIITPKTSIIR